MQNLDTKILFKNGVCMEKYQNSIENKAELDKVIGLFQKSIERGKS
jgi:hypothetical protein